MKNGEVKFSNPDLSEGTIATVKCSDGWDVVGSSKLKCVGGVWDSNLPQCSESAPAPLGMFMSGHLNIAIAIRFPIYIRRSENRVRPEIWLNLVAPGMH